MKLTARRLALAALIALSTLAACTPASTPGAGASTNPGAPPSSAPSTGGGIGY
jgi:hypothetical protein